MKRSKTGMMAFVVVLALASLACGAGNGNNGGDSGNSGDTGPDLSATQASLEATQAAMADSGSDGDSDGNANSNSNDGADDGDAGDSGSGEIDPSAFNSGDVMYSTEFDPDGNWDDRWRHFPLPEDNDDYTAVMEFDVLFIAVEETDTAVYVVFSDLFLDRRNADVYLETGFDNVGSVRNNNISLMCRVTEDGWYEFSVASNGLWWIYKYTDSDGKYNTLAEGGVPNYNKNVTAHTIGASCIGDQLAFYYDGELLKNGEFRDSSGTFREGLVGISVYAANLSDVEVEFEYFQAIKQ